MKLNLSVSLCNVLIAVFAASTVALIGDRSKDVRDANVGLLSVSVAAAAAVVLLPLVLKNKTLTTLVDSVVGMTLIVLGILGVVRTEEFRKVAGSDTTSQATLACSYAASSLALVCGIGMAAVTVRGAIKL
jgi:hypothetical protein